MYKHPQLEASTPFLKYVGGKSRLIDQLFPLMPIRGCLVEPFVGAGSVFLAFAYDRYLLGDANPDLMAMWTALKQRPREFIAEAERFFVPENLCAEAYLRTRAEFNASADRFERAVRLVYLNKLGFNGLYRVNKSGAHNVPYSRPASMPRFPFEEMEAAAKKLERCELRSGGFAGTMADTGFGDAVYCDPPYSGQTFTGYTAGAFGSKEHRDLVACAERAVGRGATVLISNHDLPETRELYNGWELHSLSARRSVSAASKRREVVNELVAILRP